MRRLYYKQDRIQPNACPLAFKERNVLYIGVIQASHSTLTKEFYVWSIINNVVNSCLESLPFIKLRQPRGSICLSNGFIIYQGIQAGWRINNVFETGEFTRKQFFRNCAAYYNIFFFRNICRQTHYRWVVETVRQGHYQQETV